MEFHTGLTWSLWLVWFASLAAANAGGTAWLAASQATTPPSPCKPRMEPSTQSAEDRKIFVELNDGAKPWLNMMFTSREPKWQKMRF